MLQVEDEELVTTKILKLVRADEHLPKQKVFLVRTL